MYKLRKGPYGIFLKCLGCQIPSLGWQIQFPSDNVQSTQRKCFYVPSTNSFLLPSFHILHNAFTSIHILLRWNLLEKKPPTHLNPNPSSESPTSSSSTTLTINSYTIYYLWSPKKIHIKIIGFEKIVSTTKSKQSRILNYNIILIIFN